ncbi:hypothetical protein JTB14_035161 [Gonioctena quinquepunctata]|nr:hypothetical protein JTB14_035161 [Gonioctena quinquepunctata]
MLPLHWLHVINISSICIYSNLKSSQSGSSYAYIHEKSRYGLQTSFNLFQHGKVKWKNGSKEEFRLFKFPMM